jgi:putative Mn2+ efflux pump MntP
MSDLLLLLLTALGLAGDATAVCLAQGLRHGQRRPRLGWILALACGGAQALMSWLGWLVGRGLERWIADYDHWVACGLLTLMALHMLWESRHDSEADDLPCGTRLALGVTVLALATSIDAAVVGVSLAAADTAILPTITITVIGVVTAVLCLLGFRLGGRVGRHAGRWATAGGGVLLLILGGKILYGHLAAG